MSPSLRADFPVPATHSVRDVSWYVGDELEMLCEMDNVTYMGCEAIMAREKHMLEIMYNKHQNEHLDHIRRYREAHPDDARPFDDWPDFEQWCGRKVPLGGALRKRLTNSHYAIGSGGDEMSRHEADVRAMQSVGTTQPNETGIGDQCVSSDHTYATAAAFCIPGKLKVWNLVTGWLIPLICILVASTASLENLHAIECLAHRKNFAPKVHFTDTWPLDRDLWYALLLFTLGRLDIFHFMKRLSSTLRSAPESKLFD